MKKVSPSNLPRLIESSLEVSALLKSLAHQDRLLLLCFIGEGEKTVNEIEEFLGASQSSVSQNLTRLRDKGLLSARREGKFVFYRILNPQVTELIQALESIFCKI